MKRESWHYLNTETVGEAARSRSLARVPEPSIPVFSIVMTQPGRG